MLRGKLQSGRVLGVGAGRRNIAGPAALLGALILVGIFVWAWIFGVELLYGVSRADVQLESARLAAISGTRTGLLALLIGFGALGTFFINARTLRLSIEASRISERGHLTDRFAKAVEQIGSPSLDVRLGGIYGLEQLAIDSEIERSAVVEIISAYVREHAAIGNVGGLKAAEVDESELGKSATGRSRPVTRLATDIQAAITVLGRLPRRGSMPRADLRGAQLSRCNLDGSDLSDANLRHVQLEDARLVNTNLAGAQLARAVLVRANLHGASLKNARVVGARLDRANLLGADLSGVDLRLASLVGAQLHRADLSGAKLQDAQLQGASLGDAGLLGDAIGVTQAQLDSAHGDATTRLPRGYSRPSHWSGD